MKRIAPQSITELMQRAQALNGFTLQQLAQQYEIKVPINLQQNKGWIGQVLEIALGTTAANLAEPDFQHLGVELKTLPLNAEQEPRESTFVASIPLLEVSRMTWETSVVKKKLSQVLWIPFEAEPAIPVAERRIGQAILWQPTLSQQQILQADWEELIELICLGKLEQMTARQGRYLQIRPKAANAKALCWAYGANGNKIQTLPRGFYLRTKFTTEILNQYQ